EPVQGGSAVTLLTSATSITDADGGHLASATVQVTSGLFSGDELFVNGQQSGTLDSGAIHVAWDNSNKILTLTGYDTLAEYQTLLGEVSFQETGNDTANLGGHTTRTITWQANDGAIGNPSGTNTQTTNITIDRPPTQATHAVGILEGGSVGPTSAGDTDPDADPIIVTAVQNASNVPGTLGTALTGTYGSLTLKADDTYSYTASNTYAINAAATGSHPTDTFTYTVSDSNGGATNETLAFTIDRPPTAVTHNVNVVESASTGTVSAGDTDPDGDSVTVTALTGGTVGAAKAGAYGSLTINANDTYSYTANNISAINAAATGSHPTDTFTYTVSDGNGGTATETLAFA